MVQRFRLCASTAGSGGSIPGRGTKILASHAAQPKKKEKEEISEVALWLGPRVKWEAKTRMSGRKDSGKGDGS